MKALSLSIQINEQIIYFSQGFHSIVTFNDYRLYDIHIVVEGSFDTFKKRKYNQPTKKRFFLFCIRF